MQRKELRNLLSFAMTEAGQRGGDDSREDARLRELIDAAPIPMALSRKSDGLILHANEEIASIFGFRRDEIVGRRSTEFYADPRERRAVVELLATRDLVRGCEAWGRRANGKRVRLSVWFREVEFGGEPAILGCFYDISERERAESALREGQARDRALLELVPDNIYRISKDGVYLDFVSGKHVEPLAAPSEFLGRRLDEVLPKKVAERAAEALKLALETGEAQQFDHHLTIEGRLRHFDARVVAINEDEGLAFVRDVTERVRAQEALRESESKFRALAEAPSVATYIVQGSRFVYVGPGMEKALGYSRDEFLGINFWDTIHPDHREMVRQRGLARQSGEDVPTRYEVKCLTKAGEERWFEVAVSAIELDGHPAAVGMAFDITDRKRAEEALRHSEERYRALYEDNPAMYFTVDTAGAVLSVNRFGAEQLGYEVDELLGRAVIDIFHPEDRDAVAEQLRQCIESPGGIARWEFRKLRKDGSEMWVREAARAVRGPEGDLVVLIVCEDITRQKDAEEALRETREQLESRVEDRLSRGVAYGLTFRELMVLHLVAEGRSDKEIATLLDISIRTANKHLENILNKMSASSRTEAGVRAVREGLL